MNTSPALLQIPGTDPSLLVPPEHAAKVSFLLHGMRVAHDRENAPGSFAVYRFPSLEPEKVKGIVSLLMRDTRRGGITW